MSDAESGRKTRAPGIESLDRVVIAGLGNPGRQYADTRHNIGFMVAEELARRWGIVMSRQRFDSAFGDGLRGNRKVVILTPNTYMNLSGRAVAPAARFFDIEDGALVVVHDEIELPFGRIRLKFSGGHAGHNGLRSIDQELGTKAYFRIRMGVGRPRFGQVKDYVLSRFSKAERAGLQDVIGGGADAVEQLLEGGLKAAQNEINGRCYFEAADSADEQNQVENGRR